MENKDTDPQPGSSKESNAKGNDNKSMGLADFLSHPDNKDANLIVPLPWCPHLDLITKSPPPLNIDVQKESCEECGHVGENWICLICLTIHCSRYVNEHMLKHGDEKEHPLTLSFSDISVWCYVCNDYLDNPKLYPFQNVVHKSKFGEDMPKCNIADGVVELEMK